MNQLQRIRGIARAVLEACENAGKALGRRRSLYTQISGSRKYTKKKLTSEEGCEGGEEEGGDGTGSADAAHHVADADEDAEGPGGGQSCPQQPQRQQARPPAQGRHVL